MNEIYILCTAYKFYLSTVTIISEYSIHLVCFVSYSEQALLTARRDPVLSRDRVYERIKYPNVYDLYAEATRMPAFVGGARVRLEHVFVVCEVFTF